MHNVKWLALLGQAANIAAMYMQFASPHTAAIIGGALMIVQAVCPSVTQAPGAVPAVAK